MKDAVVLKPASDSQKSLPWEKIASPGHVLYEQIKFFCNAQSSPAKIKGLFFAGLLFVLGFICIQPASYVPRVANWVRGHVVALYDSKPPRLAQAVAKVPRVEQVETLTDINEAATWLNQVVAKGAPNAKELGCTFPKVTDAWPVAPGVTACRQSKDGSRLWVWGVTSKRVWGDMREVSPVMAVFRFGHWDSSKTETWQVRSVSGFTPLPGLRIVDMQFVPKAASEDFPELVIKE